MTESFVTYRSFHEALKDLPMSDYGLVMYAINEYALNDNEIELNGLARVAFMLIKPQLDANKRRKEAGTKGGRPAENTKPMVSENIETEKPMVIESETETKPMVSENIETEKPNVNVNVNVNANENENLNANSHTERVCEETQNTSGIGKSQTDCYNLVTEHNKTAKKERAIPVSRSFMSFLSKEMRLLYSEVGTSEPPERITASLKNFIKVAKSDTWRKSFTWASFCKGYNDFTPEFFSLDRYLNQEPQTDDATKKPENVFFFAHKDDPKFHVDVFQNHIEDWKAEGRPDGDDYYALQDKWEGKSCS